MQTNSFFQKDILTADQFNLTDLTTVIETAKSMRKLVHEKGISDELRGKIMTALFYEPSSRTFGSFVTAIQRLGGGFIPLQGVTYSSVVKGETLEDTVRTFANYSDIVVLRHPMVGAARIAADVCDKPIINAGDGIGEHPTQALLDIFTIVDHFGSLNGRTITLVGDLRNGRTAHSLTTLILLHKVKMIHLIAPPELRMPDNIVAKIKNRGIAVHAEENFGEVLADTDVLYVTRVQKERFSNLDVYEKLKDCFVVTADTMKKLNKKAIVMHPFPRVSEIETEVDDDPRAVYLQEEMQNGMYVRMALLKLVLTNK